VPVYRTPFLFYAPGLLHVSLLIIVNALFANCLQRWTGCMFLGGKPAMVLAKVNWLPVSGWQWYLWLVVYVIMVEKVCPLYNWWYSCDFYCLLLVWSLRDGTTPRLDVLVNLAISPASLLLQQLLDFKCNASKLLHKMDCLLDNSNLMPASYHIKWIVS
jgi:hypothetical protein